jgi:DNA recombination protein RmuC
MDIVPILGIASIGALAIILILLVFLLRRGAGGSDVALVAELRDQVDAARDEAANAQAARLEAERQAAALRSELAVKSQAFEKLAETATQAAKAAALESAAQMSNKLLADHKREAEAQKEDSQKKVQQVTEGVTRQMAEVAQVVAATVAQQQKDSQRAEAIHRMLSHPGGAGRLAEIGLENTLKAFGLQPGIDFIMQFHAAGDGERGSLRPDAIIFLPGDTVLVVDSKASKLLLDHAEAEGEQAEAVALQQLAQRMATHLRQLTAKDYGSAVLSAYKETKRGGSIKRSIVAMTLPNDAAVEKLRLAAPDFEQRAIASDVILAGPSSLFALIAYSRMQIDSGRQAENLDKIVDLVTKLTGNLAVSLGHVVTLNKSVKSAADALSNFSGSINRNVLPQIRQLAKYGIRPSKTAPEQLARLNVSEPMDDVIEADVEDVTPQLPGFSETTGLTEK